MDRRKFIASNIVAIPFVKGTLHETKTESSSMKIKFYCPRWGANDSWDSFCQRVNDAGYDGIEASISNPDAPEKEELLTALKKYKLELVGQYWQSLEKEFNIHKATFEKYLRALAALKPIFINSQTGKDYFTVDQNLELIQIARKISTETRIDIIHETHRGKALFAVPMARQYFDKDRDFKITLDISHWCNVHESMLQDQAETITQALSRTRHIHSRVGHPEGPQVNDPRADEWKEVVSVHLKWWDEVVNIHRKEGLDLTITTEFGPPTYMPVLPFTQQPVASQWDINVHMMKLLKERYK
jgi:sugar phosphate isomerase/epimerase